LSRLRSTPAKATPAKGKASPAKKTTSRTPGRPGVYVATPKSDIYVALLGVSLGSMVLATLLLTVIMGGYDFKVTP